ncbi:MAG: Hsp20/alpha crystallin family protein [Prevotella sp.]|jgi:HSP20 family protein
MYTRNGWLPDVFNDFFNNENMVHTRATAPAINVLESEDQYTVQVAAPGLRREDFEVNLNQEGDLVIKMDAKRNEQEEQAHYLRREFSYTKYEQTLILPDDVDRQKIGARVADGVLTVDLPKIRQEEQRVARNIEIG